jgi:hypothetical protein
MEKDKQIRIRARTVRLLRMFAGELQREIGENISDDAALFGVFKRYRPDLVDHLEELERKESDKD